jgi:molybdopterin molybdotransferase
MSDDQSARDSKSQGEFRPWQDLEQMLSVDDARDRILSAIRPCSIEPVAVHTCHGLVLAEDVLATDPVPPFRNSAMDGYAVRASDLAGADWSSPVELKVISNLPAGVAPDRDLGPRQAIRIMTGAVVPASADTVVRFEETSDPGEPLPGSAGTTTVQIYKALGAGANVREAGEDICTGQIVAKTGDVITPALSGVLAAVNRPFVNVIRRPRVGILATGDEVADPGDEITPGQIRNSNNALIAGLVREAGAVPVMLGIARDTAHDIRAHLANLEDIDLIVTSGGVSVGDYDVVKNVLDADGHIDLWQVRIKPGKPMAFGNLGDTPLIGLPGNPVAAFVAFLQFGNPAIACLRGLDYHPVATRKARLLHEHENRGNRRHFVRGIYRWESDELVVEAVPVQGSGVLTSITRANCLFVIPESLNWAPANIEVDIIPLNVVDRIN